MERIFTALQTSTINRKKMQVLPIGFDSQQILNLNPNIFIDANNPNNNAASIPTDGTALSTLTDLTGLNTFTQATGAAQPTYKTAIINGQNIIRFAGAQWMNCNNNSKNQFAANSNLSIFCIANSNAISGFNTNFFVNKGVFPVGGYGSYAVNAALDFAFVATTKAQYECTTNVFSGTFKIYTALFTAASGSTAFYLNGGSAETKTGTTGSAASTAVVNFGSDQANLRTWNGDIQCVIVFYRLLNTNELNAVISFLKSRLGI
jgi:hypothetical protein